MIYLALGNVSLMFFFNNPQSFTPQQTNLSTSLISFLPCLASEDTFVMDLEDEDTTLEASTDCVDNVCMLPTDTQSTVGNVQDSLATKHSENSLYMVSTISLVW